MQQLSKLVRQRCNVCKSVSESSGSCVVCGSRCAAAAVAAVATVDRRRQRLPFRPKIFHEFMMEVGR